MDDAAWERLAKIEKIAKEDPKYQQLRSAYLAHRQEFLQRSQNLPGGLGGLCLDYINLVADMAYQEVLIACQNMRFPDEENV